MSTAVRVSPEKPFVLVVDDEPAMLRVLVWALRDVGTTVAHSAEEALVLLERHEFGALVSDNSMPSCCTWSRSAILVCGASCTRVVRPTISAS